MFTLIVDPFDWHCFKTFIFSVSYCQNHEEKSFSETFEIKDISLAVKKHRSEALSQILFSSAHSAII